jgi:very-short-patch-repair endonuclease
LRTLARSGEVVRTRPGVYATKATVEKAAVTPRLGHALAVLSARLTVGVDAVASHHSAAVLHGLEMLHPPPTGVVSLTRARKHDRHGYKDIVFYAGTLPSWHVTKWQGNPLTTIPRTVVDLARTLPFMAAVVVADSAFRADQQMTKSEFRHVLEHCVNWPGIERARQAIQFTDPSAGAVLESCLRVFLREWGFDPPETQVTIVTAGSSFDVDFLYPKYNTIIEADGMLKYEKEGKLRKQFDRDRLLRDAGYKVVHVIWQEVFYEPQVVIGRIRRAFEKASPY